MNARSAKTSGMRGFCRRRLWHGGVLQVVRDTTDEARNWMSLVEFISIRKPAQCSSGSGLEASALEYLVFFEWTAPGKCT